jgi:hypothetical protein
MIDRCVLVGTERFDVNTRSIPGHSRELLPSDEPAPTTQRDQLRDPVTIARNRERLPMLDSVHDLLGPVAQIPLGDLWLDSHGTQDT